MTREAADVIAAALNRLTEQVKRIADALENTDIKEQP